MTNMSYEEFKKRVERGDPPESFCPQEDGKPGEITVTATLAETVAFLCSRAGDDNVEKKVKEIAAWRQPALHTGAGPVNDLDRLLDVADRICGCVFCVAILHGTRAANTYPEVQVLLGNLASLKGGALVVPYAPHVSLREWEERIDRLAQVLEAGTRLTGLREGDDWRQQYSDAVARVRAVRALLPPTPGPSVLTPEREYWQFAEQIAPWWAAFSNGPPPPSGSPASTQGGGVSAAEDEGCRPGHGDPAAPKLSNPAWLLVELLQAAQAFDERSKKTLSELATMLNGDRVTTYDAAGLARYSAELRHMEYTDSLQHRGGGIWLTAEGKKLRPRPRLRPDQLQKATSGM